MPDEQPVGRGRLKLIRKICADAHSAKPMAPEADPAFQEGVLMGEATAAAFRRALADDGVAVKQEG